ncbi:MAG: hypothetical protein M1835_006104 [Candelina submexicana]|nr:MAG: hypothetical protein M1835_006104 [Candelina submexicana]
MSADSMPFTGVPLSGTSSGFTTPNNERVSKVSQGNHPIPNPRSCTTCRRRKVACNKQRPCANCAKAGIECIFPPPGRAPRRAKKPPDTELLARLRRLEGVVERVGVRVGENEAMTGLVGSHDTTRSASHEESDEGSGPPLREQEFPSRPTMSIEPKVLDIELGRLAMTEGKSRYVSNNFWASLSDEVSLPLSRESPCGLDLQRGLGSLRHIEQVEDIKDILNEPSEDDSNHTSPESNCSPPNGQQGFIFGFNSNTANIRILHPPPAQIAAFWHLYTENVDPLIKILHRPTMQKMIYQVKDNLEEIGKGNEALLFAMYFSVVTSLPPHDCRNMLGEEKDALLSRFRFGVEQALARANLLTSQELVTLQAFVIYLISVRRHDDTRFVWTLCGLAIRIAQSLGLHRDGSAFGLSPYETEMRRRIWWSICILDIRVSEEHGSDPTIIEQSFDTKLPLNVNDDQLEPEAKDPPIEHQGCTDMTFCLIRYEVSNTMRRLDYTPPGPGYHRDMRSAVPLAEKEKWIEDCHQRLEDKYLRYCDMTVPLYWVTATVARLIMAKMWLIVHHPFQRQDGGFSLPQDTKDRLFATSVEVIEYSRMLETERTTVKWGWLFRSFIQWHAVAFILSELCVRTRGVEVDRAWQMIETVFKNWMGDTADLKKGSLWRPMKKLYIKAKASRDQEYFNGSETPSTCTGPPSSATTNPSSVDTFNPFPLPDSTMNTFGLPPTPVKELSYSESLLRDEPQTSHETISHWLVDDATLMPGLGDDSVDWSSWDNMLNDFQLEVDHGQGMERGPVLGGMGNWW